MQIDRILFPIASLGPGNRLVIWTVGCTKSCPKCSNQELWQKDPRKDMDVEELSRMLGESLDDQLVDGVTITGGDPLEQPSELLRLLQRLKPLTEDILLYTGYTLEEIRSLLGEEFLDKLKEQAAVLIEGRYVEGLNDNQSVLKGSTNQRIIYLKPHYETLYESYLSKGRKVQNVYYGNKIISVGIHRKE